MEIYNEEIRDLLAKNPTNRLELKEDPDKGVYVKDLTAVVVKDYAEIDQVLTLGNKHRTVGAVRPPHTPPSDVQLTEPKKASGHACLSDHVQASQQPAAQALLPP